MDVSGELHILPSLIQVKNLITPELVWSFWRIEKFLSLLQFEPWTIQTVEQMLYTPQHSSSQNNTLKQVMTSNLTTLKGTLRLLCRKQGEPQSQSGLVQKI